MNDGDNVNDDDDRDDIISFLACCKISVWAFTFTFQNYLKLWKQLLLSLVIPQLIIQEDSRGRCIPHSMQEIATL